MKSFISLISVASLSAACGAQDLTDAASQPAAQMSQEIPQEIHQEIPQEEPASTQINPSARLLPSIEDAGKCTTARIGELIYVATEETFYHCDKDSGWSEINLRGQDGKDGEDGENGVAGRDGKDGQNGRDGQDGRKGQDGRDATFQPIGVHESVLFDQDMCRGIWGYDQCQVNQVQVAVMNDEWAFMTANIEQVGFAADFSQADQLSTTTSQFVKADVDGNFAMPLGLLHTYRTLSGNLELLCHWFIWDTSENEALIVTSEMCLPGEYLTGLVVDYGLTITTFDSAAQ